MKKFLFATMVAFLVSCGSSSTSNDPELDTKFVSFFTLQTGGDVQTLINSYRSVDMQYSTALQTMLGDSLQKVLNGRNLISGASMHVYYIDNVNVSSIEFVLEQHRNRYFGQVYNAKEQEIYGFYTQTVWRNSKVFGHLWGVDSKDRKFYAIATYPAGNVEGLKP